MPRMHPQLGVEVMKPIEFFEKEAERNGTTIARELESFWEGLDRDTRQWEASLHERLVDEVAEIIDRHREEDGEGFEPIPVPVVKIASTVRARQMLRESGYKATLVAAADDGHTYRYEIFKVHFSGSYFDPPEDEYGLEWERVS